MPNLYSEEDKAVTERRHSRKRKTPISPIYKIVIVVLAAAFVFSTVQYLIKRQNLMAKKEALLESIREQEDLSKNWKKSELPNITNTWQEKIWDIYIPMKKF